MDNPEIRARLQKAANLDEVKAILTEAGTDYTPEEAERILQEIEHHRPSDKRKLDPDEMDAVAGGADRNWVDDGCAATCEDGSHCWTSDKCYWLDVTYNEFHDACVDGGHHDYVFLRQQALPSGNTSSGTVYFNYNIYECSKCGKSKTEKA